MEDIPKKDVLDGLKMATRRTSRKGEYSKGGHSFEILERIDPKAVRCLPNVDRLLKVLDKKLL
jgi:hypothetical protein